MFTGLVYKVSYICLSVVSHAESLCFGETCVGRGVEEMVLEASCDVDVSFNDKGP